MHTEMDIDSPRPASPTPLGAVDAQHSTTSQPPSQPQSESQPQPQSRPEPQSEQPTTQSSESQPSSSQVTQTETQLTSTSTDNTTIPSSAPSSQAQDDNPPAPSTPPAAPAPTSPPQRESSADSATRRGEDEPIETDSTPLANGHARLASPMNGSSTLPNGMHPREETEHDTSSSSSVSAAPSVSAATDAQPDAAEDDDLDRFLRRMDTEKVSGGPEACSVSQHASAPHIHCSKAARRLLCSTAADVTAMVGDVRTSASIPQACSVVVDRVATYSSSVSVDPSSAAFRRARFHAPAHRP